MKLSICDCGQLLQFEHVACRRCGAPLGFIPGDLELTTLAPSTATTSSPPPAPDERWRRCVNAEDARLQLAGAGRRGRPALRRLPAEPQPRRHARAGEPGEVARCSNAPSAGCSMR